MPISPSGEMLAHVGYSRFSGLYSVSSPVAISYWKCQTFLVIFGVWGPLGALSSPSLRARAARLAARVSGTSCVPWMSNWKYLSSLSLRPWIGRCWASKGSRVISVTFIASFSTSKAGVLRPVSGSTIQYWVPAGVFHSYQNLSESRNQLGVRVVEKTICEMRLAENCAARS